MADFVMPSLGADMEAGKLVEWLVKPGDTVSRGDVVAVVETQKGAIEIEIFEPGTILELVAEIGRTLPVGEVLARIGTPDGEDAATAVRPTPSAQETTTAPTAGEIIHKSPVVIAPGARASPAARVAARDAGIDLRTVEGSGPNGAVRLADVEAAQRQERPRPGMRGKASDMRKAIAAAMARSKRDIPHFYVTHAIETQGISDWLAERNRSRPPSERVLLGAAFVKAAALAAAKVGVLNGRYEDDRLIPSEHVHLGVAIALRDGGLVAPAVEAAEALTLDAVMACMRDVTTRARAGRLRSSEFTRATFTVSSLGDGGAEAMNGIIFPPQVALLTVGSPQVRPWVIDGIVAPREVTTFGLSADHRVCDGRDASRFLTELEARLQDPESL